MILTTQKHEVLASEVFEKTEFKIKSCAKAFRILSAGIYSDKVKAVVRELSTNAVDAQMEAGNKDAPIEVHLPSYIEPWFSVKDNGVGMSHDFVMNNYSTYFESTRDQSNDAIGCLGLGSKSPFCVTDSFNVIVRKDGVIRHYNIYVNEEGNPTIIKMLEDQTDDCNGTEVKVPVTADQIVEFKNKALAVYQFFKVKPSTNIPLKFDTKKRLFESGDWVLDSVENTYNYTVTILMGNIGYPVDVDTDGGYTISVPIGYFDITSSREALSLTAENKKWISDKIKAIKGEIVAMYNKELSACTCLFDALLLRAEKIALTQIGAVLAGAGVWENHILAKEACLFYGKAAYHGTLRDQTYRRQGNDRDLDRWLLMDFSVAEISNHIKSNTFYYSIKTNKLRSRMMVVMTSKGGRHVVMQFEDVASLEEWCLKWWGNKDWYQANMIDAATLPAPAIPARTSSKFPRARRKLKGVFRLDTNQLSCLYNYATRSSVWKEFEDIDLSKGGYYVAIDNFIPSCDDLYSDHSVCRSRRVSSNRHKQLSNDFCKFVKASYSYLNNGNSFEIYGVKQAQLKKMVGSKKWKNLFKCMIDDVREKITDKTFAAEYRDYVLFDINSSCQLLVKDVLQIKSKSSELVRLLKTVKLESDKHVKTNQKYGKLRQLLSTDLPLFTRMENNLVTTYDNPMEKVNSQFEKIMRLYPLHHDGKDGMDYINAMNAYRKGAKHVPVS